MEKEEVWYKKWFAWYPAYVYYPGNNCKCHGGTGVKGRWVWFIWIWKGVRMKGVNHLVEDFDVKHYEDSKIPLQY